MSVLCIHRTTRILTVTKDSPPQAYEYTMQWKRKKENKDASSAGSGD